MKRLIAAAVLAAAATLVATAAAVNAGGGAKKSAPTGTLQLVEHEGRDVDIDNPPRRRFSAGDAFVSRNRLYDQGDQNRVGRDHVFCVVTVVSGRESATLACHASFVFANGQIAAQGSVTFARRTRQFTVPIVGGTGAYEGARGVLTITDRPKRRSGLDFKFLG
jgi:allene oxide cyclase